MAKNVTENRCKMVYAYYPNGGIRMETPTLNGVKHGVERYYRLDGTLDAEVEYQNGLQVGKERWFRPSGELEKEF